MKEISAFPCMNEDGTIANVDVMYVNARKKKEEGGLRGEVALETQ